MQVASLANSFASFALMLKPHSATFLTVLLLYFTGSLPLSPLSYLVGVT